MPRRLLKNAPLVHEDNLIGKAPYLTNIVRCDNDLGAALADTQDNFFNRSARSWIEVCCWLVEEQNARFQ